MQSSLTRVGPTLDLLQRSGLQTEIVASHSGPLGDLARAQLEHLRTLGVAPADEATEQIIVISGRSPAGG